MKSFFKTMLAAMLGMLLVLPLIGVVMLSIMLAIVASAGDAPMSISENSVLKVELRNVVERVSENPLDIYTAKFLSQPEATGLSTLKKVIQAAKEDDKIKAIMLDVSKMNASLATIEEVRNLLVEFGQEKPIYCYEDNYTQAGYYLASAAQNKYINPEGMVLLHGLSTQILFFKKMFDKLDVDMQVIRHGTFKSAVEPFMLDKMSEANRLQVNTFLKTIWNHITSQVSQSTQTTVATINHICDSLLVFNDAQYAVKSGLLNGAVYTDEFDSILKADLELTQSDDVQYVSVWDYKKSMLSKPEQGKEKIALVYAVGEIVEMENNPYNNQETIGHNVARELAKVRKDDNIKAVVLRVNSPGGSALLSEIIWREVLLTQQKKPVVVSMGDYAASGGYYISCAANYIVAQPTTLTGSIGVFGVIPNIGKLMENKLGITTDVVSTNAHSDFPNGFRALNAYEYHALQKMVERTYGTFTKRVADGRKMTVAAVDAIGQGRVWAGADAVKIGLVDTLGGMDVAIFKAAQLANLTAYGLEEYPTVKGFWDLLTNSSSWQSKLSQNVTQNTLGKTYFYLNTLETALRMEGVQARMPYTIEIQ